MNDYFKEKYFDMYRDQNTVSDKKEFTPKIDDVPKINVDSRRYTVDTTKTTNSINSPLNSNHSSNSNSNNSSSNSQPITNPIFSSNKNTHKINGKHVDDFLNDIFYYNSKNPLDLGNYADGVALGSFVSEKFGETLLEKAGLLVGTAYGFTKIKKYIHENTKRT